MTKTEGDRPRRRLASLWHTLRFRFALWTAGLLLAVLTIFGAVVYVSLAQGLSASLDDALRLNASQAAAAVEVENGRLDIPNSFIEGPENTDLRAQGFTLRLLAADGSVLRALGPDRSLAVVAEDLAAAHRQQPTFTTVHVLGGSAPVRVYTVPIVDNNQVVGIVQVAQSLAGEQEALRRLLVTLLGGGPFLVIGAGLGGYALAARALAPIDGITRTAHRISGEDLSARLNLPATEDEVGRLAATFDEMLGRLDNSFRRERQFAADASHELRTPLSAMQAILSVIREKRRTATEYEQALDDLVEEADRLRALTENLLLLARGGKPWTSSRERVNLSVLLSDVVESLRPLAETSGLSLACAIPDDLVVLGDMDGLIRLFWNLVDNAIKYTRQGSITVSAEQQDGSTVSVLVSDTGPGISAEHLPHVFDRFYRVGESRTTPGAGLGLAIAQEIARAHGGSIEVTSIAGKGSTFVVHLPLRPEQSAAL